MYKINDREVDVLEKAFEHGEGCEAVDAMWLDSGEHLSDTELELFNDIYAAELYEDAYIDAVARAYDMYKDRMKYGDD